MIDMALDRFQAGRKDGMVHNRSYHAEGAPPDEAYLIIASEMGFSNAAVGFLGSVSSRSRPSRFRPVMHEDNTLKPRVEASGSAQIQRSSLSSFLCFVCDHLWVVCRLPRQLPFPSFPM